MTDHCPSCPFAACEDCRFQPTANQEDRPMTDTNPAAGGLSEAEREARDLTLGILRHYGYTEDDLAFAESIHPGWACDNDDCFDEDGRSVHPPIHLEAQQTADIVVEVILPWLAARTEAAEREVARVTAAVEAWIDEAPEQTAGLDLLRQIIQPALSSADTGALDRERAKAWDEGMRTGTSRAMRKMSDEPNLPLASEADNPYRAAAVSPEGGGA